MITTTPWTFRTRLAELGIVFDDDDELNRVFDNFKLLADKKNEIYDEDLQALVSESAGWDEVEYCRLLSMKVTSETGATPCAEVRLELDDSEQRAQAEGSGPVDATFKAIEEVVCSGSELLLYSVNSITTGTDSQGEVTVRLLRDSRIVNGLGTDTDIVIASAKAYINALNKLRQTAPVAHPQREGI